MARRPNLLVIRGEDTGTDRQQPIRSVRWAATRAMIDDRRVMSLRLGAPPVPENREGFGR
jgi:hypothetical protein